MRKVILIIGKTGCGKSTLCRKLRKRARRIVTLDPLDEYDGVIFYDYQSFLAYAKEHYSTSGHFSFTCRFDYDLDNNFVFKTVWEMRNVLLTVEETEEYLDPRSLNADFLHLVKRGRHRDISLLCVTQRVPDISIKYRSQVTTLITFRQSEPNDLELLERYGFDKERVKNLPDFQFEVLGEPLDSISFQH